jgi:hypothetical protein
MIGGAGQTVTYCGSMVRGVLQVCRGFNRPPIEGLKKSLVRMRKVEVFHGRSHINAAEFRTSRILLARVTTSYSFYMSIVLKDNACIPV